MSCSTMLDRMLEADLHELDGTADSVLARHVRDCARCRTVASQLVSDTRSLARVIDPHLSFRAKRRRSARREPTKWADEESPSPRKRGRAFAALAAALTLLAVHAWSEHDRSATPTPSNAAALGSSGTSATATAAIARPATDIAQPPPRRRVSPSTPPRLPRVQRLQPSVAVASTAEPTTTDRVTVAPFERPLAVAPVQLDVPSVDLPLGDRVTVNPPSGVRASVIRTSTPGVTVVWLHQ